MLIFDNKELIWGQFSYEYINFKSSIQLSKQSKSQAVDNYSLFILS
jgi:hypothetical protein